MLRSLCTAVLILCLEVSYAYTHAQIERVQAYLPTNANSYFGLEAQEKKDLIHVIVESYQALAFERFGMDINLYFKNAPVLQATGGRRNGKLEMTFYSGALAGLSRAALVFVTCHELGHIFGEVTGTDTGAPLHYNPKDGVEGEADYFGGKCAQRFYSSSAQTLQPPLARPDLRDYCLGNEDGSCIKSIQSILETFRVIYGEYPDETAALNKRYIKHSGINPGYPDFHCRALSAIRGVVGGGRPSCWYNPSGSSEFLRVDQANTLP